MNGTRSMAEYPSSSTTAGPATDGGVGVGGGGATRDAGGGACGTGPAQGTDAGPARIFDRRLLRDRRDRAAAGFADHGFLYEEVAERLVDRLEDVLRPFPMALDLGCHDGALARALAGPDGKPRKGIETLVSMDSSARLLNGVTSGPRVRADEEAIPFADGSFDLVISSLALHWINDLPGALVQIRRALRPDGFMCAALLGGDTLGDLRRVLYEAEAEVMGGVSPRVSPFADIRDMGALLQRAGFALPVVDREVITVTYSDLFGLMRDLRGVGATNVIHDRHRKPTPRGVFMEAARRYAERHAEPDGRIPVDFEVLWLAAWSPAPTQQQPMRPGTADTSLAAVFPNPPAPDSP